MRTLTDILDNFVRRIKRTQEFSEVRFIHGSKSTPAEKPVRKLLVACSVAKAHMAENAAGEISHTAEIKFIIYAPQHTGGRELSTTAHTLMDVLSLEDKDGLLTEIKASDVSFDSDLSTVQQTVTATVTLPSDALEEHWISVHGETMRGVHDFSVTKLRETRPQRELLRGETGEQVLDSRYVLKLCVEAEHDILYDADVLNITAESGSVVTIYTDCKIQELTERLYEGKFLREYTLISKE